ncbi:DUF5518 domain-containing protein [Halosimplex pelagicum]|uniref:Uncharacterized protein n=1 Tax=Halosimplex pelagicum TaxID=869886 RepID=A0A7D5P8W8_9EURY|nr:DUF5518 domain-containing protein [Halosimplex pelagicum]QLH80178.1 hypothetical protein HZS54_00415 [Halosimplex pelagicum]
MTDTETVHNAGRPATDGSTDGRDPVPAAVDWILGIVTGLIGLALTAVGAAMYARVDRALLTDFVTSEGVEVNGITPAEAVTAGVPFVDWLAAGIAVTGLVLVVAAAAFVVARRRTRRRVAREGGTTATFRACAVYGAAVTALVSFIPGAAVAGGGVAAYLYGEDGSGLRIGAVAAFLGWALSLPLLVAVSAGFLAGADAIGQLGGGVALVAFVTVGELIALAINAGLGALGGFLVDKFV